MQPMTNLERASFLTFMGSNLFNIKPNCQVASAAFLKFGYHQNYHFDGFTNEQAQRDWAGQDDDYKGGRNLFLAAIPPFLLNNASVPASLVSKSLFEVGLVDLDTPISVAVSSILHMQVDQNYIFRIPYVTNGKTEVFDTVLYDNKGLPITLSDMISVANLSTPAPIGCV